ncbi:MAG: UbiA family prenyltransferase, partial [Lentisphaeria bacterium]|nr:UbiA family prenyltransferase [Lentisphaeria bacterium]
QLTIPGDIIAGFALSGAITADEFPLRFLIVCMIISHLLYSAGLILNDYFDRDVDARERPERPIPAGEVSAKSALFSGLGLIVIALALAFSLSTLCGIVALCLAGVIFIYNYRAKRQSFTAVLFMGACRAINILLGASVVFEKSGCPPQVIMAAAILFLYIAAVTWIAYYEVEKLPSKLQILMIGICPFLVLIPGIDDLSKAGCFALWLALILLFLNTTLICRQLLINTVIEKTPKFIGALIGNLIFIQGYWVAVGTRPSCIWVCSILLLWPLSKAFRRWYYAS